MEIALAPDLQRFIADQLSTGQYRDATEVVEAALRFYQTNEPMSDERLTSLKEAIEVGLADLDRGEKFSLEDVRRELYDGLD